MDTMADEYNWSASQQLWNWGNDEHELMDAALWFFVWSLHNHNLYIEDSKPIKNDT